MEAEAFVRKVSTAIERDELVHPGDRILVAVSGGADSVALLGVLTALAPSKGLTLVVWHLDHGLRGQEGERDRAFVTELAATFGYACITEAVRVRPGANLEARARQIRHARLRRAARLAGCARVALGHTANDQAETVLLRLFRGAGRKGLAGMTARRGSIIRPLLDCSREEILGYLDARGLAWVEDSTNGDRRFARNRVRQDILPGLAAAVGAGIVRRLCHTASVLREEDELLEAIAYQHLERARITMAAVGVAPLLECPAALRRRILRLWLRDVRGDLRGLAGVHLTAIDCRLASVESATLDLPGGRVRVEAGSVRWEPHGAAQAVPYVHPLEIGQRVYRDDLAWEILLGAVERWDAGCAWPADRWSAVFDADALPPLLAVRSRRRGDRIRPLGMAGSQKLQDVFIDAHVPRSRRQEWPILVAGEEILWIPGVKRSALATVQDATTRVVRAVARRSR